MKNLIFRYYLISVIGMIKLTNKAFKIKTQNEFYVAKIVDNSDMENMFKDVDSLNISCIVKVILNTDNHYLTPYNQDYFYLMPYLDDDELITHQTKMKYFFLFLAHLHNQTFYNMKVDQNYFNHIYNNLWADIQTTQQYYQQLAKTYELISFRSPSQWFFLMHYCYFYDTLKKAEHYLKQFMKTIKNQPSLRVCLNYHNFDLDHLSIKHRCLYSIDHMTTNLAIFDLYEVYQNEHFILFDRFCLTEYYLQSVTLLEEEKILLKCLICMIPCITLTNNEIENIFHFNELFNYIDSVNHFIEEL